MSARRSFAPRYAAIAILCATLFFAGQARSQTNTYGTDQRYCDHGALSQILSTSRGNLLGTAAGGAAGGLIGSQLGKSSGKTVATLLGVVGGALAGGYVGRSMDDTDQNCVGQTLEHAPANQPVAWQNPGSGSSYWVTPTQNLKGPNGEPCRNYVTQAVVKGETQRTENTACRQPDGSWIPVAQEDLRPARPAAPSQSKEEASLSEDTIFKVQQRLHELGFYVRDNIDGQWGPNTSAAVKNFQRAQGLNPSGQLDLATLSALNLPTEQPQGGTR
jgi:surface antigen